MKRKWVCTDIQITWQVMKRKCTVQTIEKEENENR